MGRSRRMCYEGDRDRDVPLSLSVFAEGYTLDSCLTLVFMCIGVLDSESITLP